MEIISKGNGTLGLGRLPGRKRMALYRMHGSSFDPIAYIVDDEDAVWLERFLIALCKAAKAENPDKIGDDTAAPNPPMRPLT